jgi:hypothetical protein
MSETQIDYEYAINSLIDDWHKDETYLGKLHYYLYMTFDEYNAFIMDANKIPEHTKHLVREKLRKYGLRSF